MSVRAWPGAVTVGILGASGRSRTEAVVSAATGDGLREYPAAVYGGAVAASLTTTVVVGSKGVTSYDNKSGHVRWYHSTGPDQPWRVDGTTLYVAKSAGGYLGSAPVTSLQVIDLATGVDLTPGDGFPIFANAPMSCANGKDDCVTGGKADTGPVASATPSPAGPLLRSPPVAILRRKSSTPLLPTAIAAAGSVAGRLSARA